MESEEVCNEARSIAAEIGDVVWYAHATRTIGMAAYAGGDHARAEALLREALDDLELIGDERCAVTMNSFLGMVELERSRFGFAARHLEAALCGVLSLDSSGRRGGSHLVRAALLAARVGDLEAAAHFGAAAGPVAAGSPTFQTERQQLDSLIGGLAPDVRAAITVTAAQTPLPDTIGEAVAWLRAVS